MFIQESSGCIIAIIQSSNVCFKKGSIAFELN